MTKTSATIRVVKDKPKRPKVDRGEEFEQLVRQMFKGTVDIWCRDNLEEQPDKETLGGVVDNLTASFTSSIETLADAATDSYLSMTVTDEAPEEDNKAKDEDDEDEAVLVECPDCKHEFEPPSSKKKFACPECKTPLEFD